MILVQAGHSSTLWEASQYSQRQDKNYGHGQRGTSDGAQGAPVRMKDIAQDMGLSTVTISKALRGHPTLARRHGNGFSSAWRS